MVLLFGWFGYDLGGWLCSFEGRGCILFLALTRMYIYFMCLCKIMGVFMGLSLVLHSGPTLFNLINATIIAVFDAGIFCP